MTQHTETPKAYLTRRTNTEGYPVFAIVVGAAPICADKPTEDEARYAAAQYGIKLPPVFWDGDRGEFVSTPAFRARSA